ncbi:hypothetical protein GCM10027580_14920 [Corynebacterium faecale]
MFVQKLNNIKPVYLCPIKGFCEVFVQFATKDPFYDLSLNSVTFEGPESE